MMEIVFVHLGNEVPVHLVANIRRMQRIWAQNEITLILNRELELEIDVSTYIYRRKVEIQELFTRSDMEDDFWTKSLERLVALADYVLSRDFRGPILHLESDVLLMPNFPFIELSNLHQLTWNRYNDKKDVGALVFIPNRRSTEIFLNAIIATVKDNPRVTDMTLLSILSNQLGIGKTFSNRLIPKNESYLGESQYNNPSVVSDFKEKGIFDPAQIGMWIAGLDPKYTFGITKYQNNSFIVNGDSEVDPSKMKYSFNQDKHFYGHLSNGEKVPIWSLHIHSKNLRLFEENWAEELALLVSKSRSWFSSHWDIRMTSSLIIENYHRKTLIRFLSHLPALKSGVKWLRKCYNFLRSK